MEETDDDRPKRPSRTQSAVYSEEGDDRETSLGNEKILFTIMIIVWELFMLVIYGVWIRYEEDPVKSEVDVLTFYDYFRDINVMIFVGFGFLMTFLRRCGFSAIGYTFLVGAIVSQWSLILDCFAESQEDEFETSVDSFCKVTMTKLMNSLFASATVLISYGAILGKVTPAQLLVMAFMEPMFFWVNIYCCIFPSQIAAIDIGGGMVIHLFGAYFGLAVTWFLTNPHTRGHEDNTSCYSSDIFSLLGTLFLWIMWPSFNAALAPPGEQRLNAIVNTFLSLCSCTVASFLFSRLFTNKFEAVHVQNSTLAGGVVMGVVAHLRITPPGALGCGWIAGFCSVFGYEKLSPFLNNKLGIQDICGVHNLHGIPGLLGSLLAVFVTISSDQKTDFDFPRGDDQPGYQMAAIATSFGFALAGGILTGFAMKCVDKIQYVNAADFYNDRTWWSLPSDYEHVVRGSKD